MIFNKSLNELKFSDYSESTLISKDRNKIQSSLWMMYGETFYGLHTAKHQLQCIKVNLKAFLQEQKLHSKRGTWAILRSFGYLSLISDPDMIDLVIITRDKYTVMFLNLIRQSIQRLKDGKTYLNKLQKFR